jgi:hypothetical protein
MTRIRIPSKFAGFAMACVLFLGCGAVPSLRDLFGGSAAPEEKPTTGAAPPSAAKAQVYYTAVEGLALYSEPRAASRVLTKLPLHQKVLRYGVERGYADVEVAGGGPRGWVDNARLLWRLPAAAPPQPGGPTAASEPAPQPPDDDSAGQGTEGEEGAPAENVPVEEPEPTPTATVVPVEGVPAAPEPAKAAPAAPASSATPPGLSPAVFDPF